ncbi:MAG TPA: superoxide dismutase family protein [Burkholderiaceae bacterium]|nr:superoxide dismutase family protein [Burkholderiaceae bacterium]
MRTTPLAALAALAALSGCGMMPGSMPGAARGPAAVATLAPAAGQSAAGSVRFEQHGDHVMVVARVTGLRPGQEHGFHVHEKGDCSSADFMSAGGHYNPGGKPHGHPKGGDRHAGDLPNLRADASGTAEARFEAHGLSVGSGAADVVGRAVVVHANPDDYASQPAGNSGGRIACAVIARG